jgi:hypothetical protein
MARFVPWLKCHENLPHEMDFSTRTYPAEHGNFLVGLRKVRLVLKRFKALHVTVFGNDSKKMRI